MKIRNYRVNGIVQGVGFRPFVHKLACELNIFGWVLNDTEGVLLEIEGNKEKLDLFIEKLIKEAPPLSKIDNVILVSEIDSNNKYNEFKILNSNSENKVKTLISPDYTICDECLNELFDCNDRRYKYPFINCTNCGPRYSIIRDLPYDRKNTTMKNFEMCPQCEDEYLNIENRRYHAQPNACYVCGPKVSQKINFDNVDNQDLNKISEKLLMGKIVAIKSVGGFHLACNAYDVKAVQELRKRKNRDFKAFAIMVKDIKTAKKFVKISQEEEKLLLSKERPIVLLQKNDKCLLDYIAPNNSKLGIMLPSAPLHYVLLKETNLESLVMTSGNVSGNPIIYKDEEALVHLSKIADDFLFNNREIYTFVDDSIVKIIRFENEERRCIIRRARGYVPLPLKNKTKMRNILALGAELKNTIAISKDFDVLVSQHLGDLKNDTNLERQKECILHMLKIFETNYDYIACDLHPLFNKGKYLNNMDIPLIEVQHHHAHMASCMFENNIHSKVIGVIFDGTGYGLDGTIWGGEFLIGDLSNFERVGTIIPTKLIGGDSAVKEPYRIALSILFDMSLDNQEIKDIFPFLDDFKIDIFRKMNQKNINTYVTTSMGRLFDAVSAILGICTNIEYEAQAAIELESCLNNELDMLEALPFNIQYNSNKFEFDYRPMIKEILKNKKIFSVKDLIRQFHSTIVKMTIEMCNKLREKYDINQVVLGGGVFQNDFLLTNIKNELETSYFKVYINENVPCNDGGISLGQIAVANERVKNN